MRYIKVMLTVVWLYLFYTCCLWLLVLLCPFRRMGGAAWLQGIDFLSLMIVQFVFIGVLSNRFIRTFVVEYQLKKWNRAVVNPIYSTDLELAGFTVRERKHFERCITCLSCDGILFYKMYGYNWYIDSAFWAKADKALLLRHIALYERQNGIVVYEVLSQLNAPILWLSELCKRASWTKVKCTRRMWYPLYFLFRAFFCILGMYQYHFYRILEGIYADFLRKTDNAMIIKGDKPQALIQLFQLALNTGEKIEREIGDESRRGVIRLEIERLKNEY